MPGYEFDPFRNFEKFAHTLSHIAEDFEKNMSEDYDFRPNVDITEGENAMFLHIELPGIDKSGIKISVNDERMLTIKGEKKKKEIEEEHTLIRNERKFGSFARSFLLPEDADIENIDAKFKNGVLELSIKKLEPQKAKEIQVDIQ
ncbi:MAG: Hsp20/alpha crystallin family protein [Candidatus Kapaibacterium sp.]